MGNKKKIAILFPAFLGGGAESVALSMIEALKIDYAVKLITFSTLDLGEVNRLYGTHLNSDEFTTQIPYENTPLPGILSSQYRNFTARQHLLLRYFKNIQNEFDLAIGAFNEMDMGKPGIQYLNSPMFGKEHEKGRIVLGYPDSSLRRLYHRIFERISDFSSERMKSNLSIGNSEWTAQLFRELYQIDVGVLYPPVILNVPEIPWQLRENGFVCISRFVPEKKIGQAIEIIEKVRERGFDVTLRLISSNYEPEYREKILKLQSERSSWVYIHEHISRTELAELIVKHRYGLHARENEQFGISVAEIVRAGCIPFVPASGGLQEIVGDIPILKFSKTADAVEKICTVLQSSNLQTDLQKQLAGQKNLFTPERFSSILISLVEEALIKK
jgi:glycosyltransferase involved in cell wall biosynthesis